MWWIIGIAISIICTFFFLSIVASGKRIDEQTHDAFIKMMKEENKTQQYDLSTTTTSGCPVKLPLDK